MSLDDAGRVRARGSGEDWSPEPGGWVVVLKTHPSWGPMFLTGEVHQVLANAHHGLIQLVHTGPNIGWLAHRFRSATPEEQSRAELASLTTLEGL